LHELLNTKTMNCHKPSRWARHLTRHGEDVTIACYLSHAVKDQGVNIGIAIAGLQWADQVVTSRVTETAKEGRSWDEKSCKHGSRRI